MHEDGGGNAVTGSGEGVHGPDDPLFVVLFTYIRALVPNNTTTPIHDQTMAQTGGKENIADGLTAKGSFRAPSQSPNKSALSPKKSSRKTRSKSIGPGGLEELEAPPLKETAGNRRKVA